MAGSADNVFLVFVEPWTLTAALYPGARWAGGVDDGRVALQPITSARRAATLGGLAGFLVLAIWPQR